MILLFKAWKKTREARATFPTAAQWKRWSWNIQLLLFQDWRNPTALLAVLNEIATRIIPGHMQWTDQDEPDHALICGHGQVSPLLPALEELQRHQLDGFREGL